MDNFTEYLYSKFLQSDGVSIDTRTLKPGDLFFGLSGENSNGSRFASQALDNGASFAVIDDTSYKIDGKTIVVPDVLKALQDLAMFHRSRFKRPVFGLTGSNGKTTTKELLVRVLGTKHIVHSTQGNYNNHIGVPLTLLGIHPQVEIAIIEMGANHVGEIAALCQFARPTHGLITNIGKAHTETFGGIEGVLRGKSELFDFLRKSGGTAFINTKDVRINNMSHRFKHPVLYPDEDLQITEVSPFISGSLGETPFSTRILGEHQFENIGAAVAVARFFKVPDKKITKAIEDYIPDNMRAQVVIKNGITILLDAYNANPDSMTASLKSFSALPGRKIAILGDMNELDDPEGEHRRIGRILKLLSIEALFVGEKMKYAAEASTAHQWFATKDKLSQYLEKQDLKGNSILIKASRSMKLETLVDKL